MNILEQIKEIEAEGLYSYVQFVKGKGICGIHRYLFTYGLAVNIKHDGEFGFVHDYRYCYPPQYIGILVHTLLSWGLSEIDVVVDPADDKWIKKKGGKYDDRNPRITGHN